MATKQTKPANWQLTSTIARLQLPKFAAQLNVLQPALGLSELAIAGHKFAGQLLRVDVPAVTSPDPHEVVDWYERRGDLVATYAQLDSRPFRTQVYWRTESHDAGDALAAIELVASVQTSLLDSRPELTVSSLLPCIEVLNQPASEAGLSQNSFYVVRLSDRLSYAEMVHPLDDHETTLQPVADREQSLEMVEIRHRLFTADLEKGVILRSRVLGLLLPRENDLEAAARHYAQFAASEPPLTT